MFSRKDVQKGFYGIRVVYEWKKLNDDTVNAGSIQKIKKYDSKESSSIGAP